MGRTIACLMSLISVLGCAAAPEYEFAEPIYPSYTDEQVTEALQPTMVAQRNPTFLPISDPQCAWETVVDVVDDYFRVEREQPVKMVGNMITEGTLTTVPEVSPTIFEPWRYDTVDRPQRIENTLQTMRRRAVIRVIPAQGGYWVDVAVYKELEDMVRPEHATAGAATFRYDSSLVGIVNPTIEEQATRGWIPRGRDTAMEQHIIAHLLSRANRS